MLINENNNNNNNKEKKKEKKMKYEFYLIAGQILPSLLKTNSYLAFAFFIK